MRGVGDTGDGAGDIERRNGWSPQFGDGLAGGKHDSGANDTQRVKI